MNSLKALFSSALALIVILMLTLFTSCAEQAPIAPETETTLPVHEAGLKMDFEEVIADYEPETLELPDGTLAVTAAKNVSAEGISVMRSAVCTSIQAHEPVGSASTFSEDVGRIYLFTKVELPKDDTATIQHVWKLNGKPISIVDLEVRGPNFRTRSYKTITDNMSGQWSVDVVTRSGDIIETAAFTVE